MLSSAEAVHPSLFLLAAVASNQVIGSQQRLPWHLPEDLAYFKRQTLGHALLMGRKTFESIGRPLPRRRNVVLTRQLNWKADGVEVVHSLQQALALCRASARLYIIGGAALFEETLPLAAELMLTEIDQPFEGDTFFPKFDPALWEEQSREAHLSATGLHFAFVRYRRFRNPHLKRVS